MKTLQHFSRSTARVNSLDSNNITTQINNNNNTKTGMCLRRCLEVSLDDWLRLDYEGPWAGWRKLCSQCPWLFPERTVSVSLIKGRYIALSWLFIRAQRVHGGKSYRLFLLFCCWIIILMSNFICRKLDNLFKKYKYVFVFITSWATKVIL